MGAACSSERHEGTPSANQGSRDAKGQSSGRDIYLVTVPPGARPGQQLLISTPQGQMRVQIPPGLGPGQQFRASIPRASNQSRGGALSAIPVDNPFRSTQPRVAAYEVRGAGSEVVNGIYEVDQQVDAVRSYRKRGTNIMLHRYPSMDNNGATVWWIADWGPGGRPADGDDTDYYFASSSSSTPPQNGWRVDTACHGRNPPPMVIPYGAYGQRPVGFHMPQPVSHSRGGAPLQLIKSLPECKYIKKNGPQKEGDEEGKNTKGESKATNDICCICLDQFKDGDSIIRLPCLHIFHSEEITKWLQKKHRCPLCQTSILQGFMADPSDSKSTT
ncbi:hypothetical protein AAMO2058_000193200 [Amorphochlora amoebiformis]